jgi:hypothetical protein
MRFILPPISFLFTSLTALADAPPLLQSQIKGLLVVNLPDRTQAGAATQMNATAVESLEGSGFRLRFNQPVGKLMKGATAEVEKFMKVRHAGKLPADYTVEFGFANKYSLKDGPSAAVACALMTEAILTGNAIDPGFAATGDMTATGEVRPIGGVAAKIRGASKKNCTIFSVPKGNAKAIDDLYLTEGLKAVTEIQIVAVGQFEEALAVASTKRSKEVETALADFEMVQKSVLRNENSAKHPKVQAKLRTILQAIPGHHSARLIALHGQGRGPSKLSLIGSLEAIEIKAGKLSQVIQKSDYRASSGFDDPLRDTVFELNRLRTSLDPRTTELLDGYRKIAEFIKKNRGRSKLNGGESAQFRQLVMDLSEARTKLRNNREIQEELMKE